MSLDVLLRLFVRLLPPLVRGRYLEEWRADLAGAAEVGSSRVEVLVGVVALLVRIDRDIPEATGEARGAVPLRFARRGGAFLLASASIAVGAWFTGGGIVPEPWAAPAAAITALSLTSWVTFVLAVAAAVAGAALLLLAGVIARTVLARGSLLALVAGPALIVAGAISEAGVAPMLAGIAVLFAGGIGALVVLAATPAIAVAKGASSRRQRVAPAVAGLALLLGVVMLGAVDVLIWNPQAKVPGVELATTYALMAERDGFSIWAAVVWVAFWVVFWTAAGVVATVAACSRTASAFTPRHVLALLLGLVGGAVFFRFFAGFGIGMSIADSFATDGGDGSLVSAVLPYVGQVALAVAVISVGWAPRPQGVRPVLAR